MYEIGSLVLYDKRGVYKVDSVGLPPVRGTTGDYYKLCAVFSGSNEIIYTPVGAASFMRPLIGSSEAVHYLELAEKLICEEFAIVLDTTPDLIRERLYAAAEHKATA